MINLIKLTEGDKRLLIAIFLLLILIFLIIGFIVDVVKRIVRLQGRKIDALMANMVNAAVLRSPKEFRREAWKKNSTLLFKSYLSPFMLLIIGVAIHLIASSFYQHFINIFDYQTEGFFTLIYIFDWPSMPRSNFFGMNLPSAWPPVINAPHFETAAIVSYFVGPIYLVGLVWLFLSTQAFLARTYRIFELARIIFSDDLSNKRLADVSTQKAGIEQPKVGVAVTPPPPPTQ